MYNRQDQPSVKEEETKENLKTKSYETKASGSSLITNEQDSLLSTKQPTAYIGIDIEIAKRTIVQSTIEVSSPFVLAIGIAVLIGNDVVHVSERAATGTSGFEKDAFWDTHKEAKTYLVHLHPKPITEHDMLSEWIKELKALVTKYQKEGHPIAVICDEPKNDICFLIQRCLDLGLEDPFDTLFGPSFHAYCTRDMIISVLGCTALTQRSPLTRDVMQRLDRVFHQACMFAKHNRLPLYDTSKNALMGHPNHRSQSTKHGRARDSLSRRYHLSFLRHTPLVDILRTLNNLKKVQYIQYISSIVMSSMFGSSSSLNPSS